MFESGVHHISINVDDVEGCTRFYVDLLGFSRIPRPDLGIGGAWLQMGPQQLHLIEAPVPTERGPHFALRVDDIHAAVSEVRSRGVEVSEPRDLAGVCLQAFFDDPAGNQVELNQTL